jgi:hypothetical protein
MSHDDVPAYGLGFLVTLTSLVFIIFAFSFSKQQSSRLAPSVRSSSRCSPRCMASR